MSESLDRRMVMAGTVAAGLAALGSSAAAAAPPEERVRLVEVKESELLSCYEKRFKKEPFLKLYPDLAISINTWLMTNKLGQYSGFWTGEIGNADGERTYQICIIRRDS